MVTIPGYESPFLPLLRSIEDKSAASDDRVDAYLRFTERLREEEDAFVSEVCNHVEKLAVVFKNDMVNPETEVCQASLQALGHCLYHQQIARTFTENDSKGLLQGLTKVISATNDKGICTRALWCIAKQNLPEDIVSDQLLAIFLSIECALKKNLQSTTVDNEAICVVDRLLQQLPDSVMIKSTAHWSKLVLPMTISSAGKVREYSLAIISSHLNRIISAREGILPWFLPVLKSGFIGEMSKLCNEKKELFVLRLWSCIVPLLGKALHRSSLINDILKLVEQGFKNPSVNIQVESYFAWQVLIDNFAINQDVLSAPKRVNLIMMPLLNSAVKERNEKVEAARLSTWWHFVCAFESRRLLDLFDKICIPLLQFIFGTSIDHVSLLKSREGFGDLKCPPTPTNGKFISNSLFETPKATARRSLKDVGTPKTPTVIHASFAKASKDKLLIQGCEILEKLLAVDDSSPSNIKFTLEDDLKEPVFQTAEAFGKHARVMINAVREAFKACTSELQDSLAMSIWNKLVTLVESVVLKERNNLFDSHFLPLLATAEELVEGSYVDAVTSLKMLERVSKLSPHLISHHCTHLQSKGNPQGSAAIDLLHLLLSPFLFKDGQNNERLFISFENLLSCVFDAPSGQLTHVQAVLQLLQSVASFSEKSHPLWRLWSSTVSKLNDHIIKSNEVNQGNALDHDFTAVYLAFLLAAKELLTTSLGQGEIRSVSKDLSELYRSFSRAAALVPSIDANTCAEELCLKLLDNWTANQAQDMSFLTGMVNLVTTILECMDYTIAPVFASKSPIKSPSKWTKKIARPLGNMASAVELMKRLITACYNMVDSKKASSNSGLLAAVMTNLIDSLSVFYQHLNEASMIAAATESLSPALVPVVRSSHTSTKEPKSGVEKAIFTTKFIQKVEKLWQDILTSIQSRHGEPYSSELLAAISPLLEVTFVHHKRQIKNQTVIFWNATFANSQTLMYPDNLRSVLLSIKDKANLTVPGLQSAEVPRKETQAEVEIEEMSQMTQPQGSPVRIKPLMFFGGSPKVKGSFLHKAAEAEKAVEKSSPKKAWTEPRLPSKGKGSTRNTHARRKLPLSLLDDDSQDFVRIAPSPTKKRLLTEHQKEVMQEKSNVPTLYNCLDQSQDAFYSTQDYSQCTPSPIEDQPAPFANKKLPATEDKYKEKMAETGEETDKVGDGKLSGDRDQEVDKLKKVSEIPETMETDFEEPLATTNTATGLETPEKDQAVTSWFASYHTDEGAEDKEEVTSPDVIPSSQLPDSPLQFKSLRRSGRVPARNNMVVQLKDVNEKDENTALKIDGETGQKRPDIKPISDITDKDELIDENPGESQENEVKDDDKEKGSSIKVTSSKKKKKSMTEKSSTSPIAGRTRRGRQLKSGIPKNSESSENNSLENQESSSSTQDIDSEEQGPETNENPEAEVIEKPEVDPARPPESLEAKALKGTTQSLFSKDVMSSPVSCAKIKFMKPNTGSPTQPSAIKSFHSPVSSPSTGILKRYNGRYDSPSPPNKVRRVSFAMPLAQEAQQKETSVNPEKPAVTQSEQTESSKEIESATTTPSRGSDNFTVIKRRRKAPSGFKEERDDSTPCIYPDLVNCSVPVEQILPSLCSFTWSRGLGHVIHAQNIRTIGNLSSLKEFQIKNLPIRSPKVQTLRAALTTFHQKTKGTKSKSARDILATLSGKDKKWGDKTIDNNLNCPATLESDDLENNNAVNEQEEQIVSIENTTNSEKKSEKSEKKMMEHKERKQIESNVLLQEVREEENVKHGENVEQREESEKEDSSKEQSACTLSSVEQKTVVLSENISLGSESAEESKQDELSVEKSYTPPLPVPESEVDDSDTVDEEVNTATPTRTACTKPTLLFTPSDDDASEHDEVCCPMELMNKIDEDLQKNHGDNIKENTVKQGDSGESCQEIGELPMDADDANFELKDGSNIEEKKEKKEDQYVEEAAKDDSVQKSQEEIPEQTIYHSLNSVLEKASPEVLARLSNEEIFLTHKNLAELMSRVVTSLQERLQGQEK